MSYILEALKKSERERQIGHVPDFTQIQETPKQAPPRWPRWLLLALLVNAVLLVVLAWHTWEAQTQRVVAVPASSVAPAPVASAPVTPAAPVVEAAAPAIAPVVESVQPSTSVTVTEEYAPVTASEAPEAIDEPESSAAPPRWDDLPLAERAELPAPSIDVHVFALEPERRFVLINLRKYRVGDLLDDGPTLMAIVNDGIVLSYKGREYRVDRP